MIQVGFKTSTGLLRDNNEDALLMVCEHMPEVDPVTMATFPSSFPILYHPFK